MVHSHNDGNTATPGTIEVYLEGLDIDRAGNGLTEILFLSGASLHVRNCEIRGSEHGINFATIRTAALVVENTTISEMGRGRQRGRVDCCVMRRRTAS